MKTTKIQIAGLNISVSHTFDFFKNLSENYLTDAKICDFSVCVDQKDIEFERQITLKEQGARQANQRDEYFESTAIYRKIAQKLPEYQAFVFHGSAVAVENEAVIFAAKSGTGKSTHTRLWLQNIPDSFVVNGDKPIIRIIGKTPTVCGTPWNGKEQWGTNKNIPLRAICLLERNDTNSIEKIPFGQAAANMILQTYCSNSQEILSKTLRIIKTVGEHISFYRLRCNTNADAAVTAYREIFRDKL